MQLGAQWNSSQFMVRLLRNILQSNHKWNRKKIDVLSTSFVFEHVKNGGFRITYVGEEYHKG